MKSPRNCFLVLAAFCGLPSLAQDLKIPQPSTFQQIEQDFGLGKIVIGYSRPNTRGRKIFDGMEPYGVVWRTGANAATKIKLTDSFLVEGHPLAPATYALFSIPGKDEWTFIFNKTENQWGAYSYDSTKDALRFKVKAGKLTAKLETFTMQFVNVTTDHCELQISWENTIVSMRFETDVDSRVMANIDQAMQGEKKPYYTAAIYYYIHNKDMKKALAWINEFDKAHPDADNAKYWKARILLKMGDKAGAIAIANEGLTLATKASDIEYARVNREVLADAKN